MKTITYDETQYQLVPIEPTHEMLDRGHHEIDFARSDQKTHEIDHPSQLGKTIEQDMRDAWAAMLNAAPAPPTNYHKLEDGQVQAVCHRCGCVGKSVRPDSDGEPETLHMPDGWSVSGFPADHQHPDGSIGSKYTCPECNPNFITRAARAD